MAETAFDGRPAWRVTYDRDPADEGESVVIDRQTGFLVAYETSEGCCLGGRITWDWALTGLRVNGALPADAFKALSPPGARLHLVEADYYCRLSAVASRVGFRPFVSVPAAVPSGYGLSEVATDGRSPTEFAGIWKQPDQGGDHRTEFLRYRRGFDSFTIQIGSLRGVPTREVAESLKPLPGRGYVAADTRMLARGPFAGRTARTWFDGAGANLIVAGDRYVAFITGALTRRQLCELAEGLRRK